jgi:antitoxin PrlF
MRRRLQGVHQQLPASRTFQAIEFFSIDHHHRIAAVQCDVLGPVAVSQANELAESRLGILKAPATARGLLRGLSKVCRFSSHADQISMVTRPRQESKPAIPPSTSVCPGAQPWFEVSTGPSTQLVDLPRKPLYDENRLFSPGTTMSTLLVSSKGQIVLPAALRRRLGMGAGARIEVLEESDGLKLRVVRAVAKSDMTQMAGMVKAKARGVPRRLEDFDPASLLTRSRRSKP